MGLSSRISLRIGLRTWMIRNDPSAECICSASETDFEAFQRVVVVAHLRQSVRNL